MIKIILIMTTICSIYLAGFFGGIKYNNTKWTNRELQAIKKSQNELDIANKLNNELITYKASAISNKINYDHIKLDCYQAESFIREYNKLVNTNQFVNS